MIKDRNTIGNFCRYATFEHRHGFINSARAIFERAVEFFGDEYLSEELLIKFAEFEEKQKEHERARAIYKYALDRMSKEQCVRIYEAGWVTSEFGGLFLNSIPESLTCITNFALAEEFWKGEKSVLWWDLCTENLSIIHFG